MSVTQTWDGVGRLTSQSVAQGPADGHVLLQHRAYAYRADGFLTEIHELTSGTRHFELDPRGRVTAVHARDWTERYAYDSVGNLNHATTPAVESAGSAGRPERPEPSEPADAAREFTGTRLHRAGRERFEYDAQGRVVRATRRLLNGQTRSRTYTWDGDDRLSETVTPDGTRWRYTYDPAGRRTAKRRLRADGTIAEETVFSWDGTRLAERTTTGGRTTTWDYAPGTYRPLTQLDREPGQDEVDARFHAIVTDLLGTPTELVSPDGELAWQQRTTLWGARLAEEPGEVDCPLRFPGQYADAETGWHYNVLRYYDPHTMRYTAPDPLGLAPAPNDYAYVDNVLRQADPLGLTPCEDAGDGADAAAPQPPTSLYHYTTEDSMNKIVDSKEMFPSLKADNPKDARYGDGQYLTDIVPGTKTQGQLSAAFLRVPWAGKKFTHYVEIDTTGLNVVEGRPGVFVIPNSGNLDLTGRILSHGAN
jgi:RHS repeat-associated protein